MGLLFLSLFNSILGLSILFPVIGPLGRDLGLDEVEIGLLSTSYSLMQLFFAPIWGRASETRGRKPILLVGILGFAGGFLCFGMVAEAFRHGLLGHGALVGLSVLSRAIGGALSSATLPTAQAYAADITERADRTAGMAVIGAAFGLAVIFGPVIGATVSHFFGLLAPVWFSVGIGLLNAVLVFVRLPEPARRGARETGPVRSADIARRTWPLLALGALATLANVAMEQTVSFLFEDRLGLSHDETPKWVGGGLLAYGILAVFAQGFLVRRTKFAPRTLVLAGLPLTALGMAGLAFATSFPVLLVCMAFQGLGQGLVVPGLSAALSVSVDDHEQGAAAGLSSAGQGLGRFLGPLTGTSLYAFARPSPYLASAALLGLLMVLAAIYVPKPLAETA